MKISQVALCRVLHDADNLDPLPLKKVTEATSRPSMLQQMLFTSNQSEDLSVHENESKEWMSLAKSRSQFGVEHHLTKESAK